MQLFPLHWVKQHLIAAEQPGSFFESLDFYFLPGTDHVSRLRLEWIYANTQTQLCLIYCLYMYNIHSMWISSKDIIFIHNRVENCVLGSEHINQSWHQFYILSTIVFQLSYNPHKSELFNRYMSWSLLIYCLNMTLTWTNENMTNCELAW